MKNKTNMINVLFKSLKMMIVVSFVVGVVFVLSSCDDLKETPEQAKNQTATITNLFGEGYSATVKGTLTDAEWNGVADKIDAALNSAFKAITGNIAIEKFVTVFSENDVTIIVEKNTNGYTTWKTSADGKIMYLAYGKLDMNLQGSVDAAVAKMHVPEAGHAQVKKQNRVRFGGGMSPFELA